MAGVSLDGRSEVEPLRRLYGHDLEHWLIDHLDLTAGETALELASAAGPHDWQVGKLTQTGAAVK